MELEDEQLWHLQVGHPRAIFLTLLHACAGRHTTLFTALYTDSRHALGR